MTVIKAINNLVTSQFGENLASEKWTKNSSVQSQLSKILNRTVKDKDPLAPRRAKSTYLIFCDANRAILKTKLGDGAKTTDVTKALGVEWARVKASNKAADKKALAEFQTLAAADKERYETEKAAYIPREGFEKLGRKKQPNGPPKAKSAYLYFCGANRDAVKEDNPNFKATEITADLGRRWNLLKNDSTRGDELAKFQDMAAKDKKRYEEAKENMQTGAVTTAEVVEEEVVEEEVVEEEAKTEAKTAPKSVTKAATKTAAKAKSKRPGKKNNDEPISYDVFCEQKRKDLQVEFPKAKPAEITKKISAAWKLQQKN